MLSYAAGLVPFDPERVVALRRVGDAVFKRPVQIGDTIHVEGEVVRTRELDAAHGLVSCRWQVRQPARQARARATSRWSGGAPRWPPVDEPSRDASPV